MTKITIETETIETDLTPSEAAAKIKEALGIAEWPQIGNTYWSVNVTGEKFQTQWDDDPTDHHRLSIGNCSPTQEGLARYKAIKAKQAALWAIEQHRDKTFGVFEPDSAEATLRYYGEWAGQWFVRATGQTWGAITVPFRTQPDIERSFAECGEHWEVLK